MTTIDDHDFVKYMRDTIGDKALTDNGFSFGKNDITLPQKGSIVFEYTKDRFDWIINIYKPDNPGKKIEVLRLKKRVRREGPWISHVFTNRLKFIDKSEKFGAIVDTLTDRVIGYVDLDNMEEVEDWPDRTYHNKLAIIGADDPLTVISEDIRGLIRSPRLKNICFITLDASNDVNIVKRSMQKEFDANITVIGCKQLMTTDDETFYILVVPSSKDDRIGLHRYQSDIQNLKTKLVNIRASAVMAITGNTSRKYLANEPNLSDDVWSPHYPFFQEKILIVLNDKNDIIHNDTLITALTQLGFTIREAPSTTMIFTILLLLA